MAHVDDHTHPLCWDDGPMRYDGEGTFSIWRAPCGGFNAQLESAPGNIRPLRRDDLTRAFGEAAVRAAEDEAVTDWLARGGDFWLRHDRKTQPHHEEAA